MKRLIVPAVLILCFVLSSCDTGTPYNPALPPDAGSSSSGSGVPLAPGNDEGPVSVSERQCVTPCPEGPGGAPIGDVPSAGFNAWLECGDHVQVIGTVSYQCDVSVSGWNSNSYDRVEVVFPQQVDLMGHLSNGLLVTPGNSSGDPTNMHNTGVLEQTDHYSFPEGFSQGTAPPGIYSVVVVVRQAGVGTATLNLTVEVTASTMGQGVCPGTASPALSWLGYATTDILDAAGYTPDTFRDGVFRLTISVDNPQSVITYLGLQVVDSGGQAVPGVYWASSPAADAWFLAVASGNQWLNQPGWPLNAAVPGNAVLDLFASDRAGYLVRGQTVWVTAYFGNNAGCYTQASALIW